MPKIPLAEALIENEDRIWDKCRTCTAPADESHEPYCRHCGDYWRDVEAGLFDEDLIANQEDTDNE